VDGITFDQLTEQSINTDKPKVYADFHNADAQGRLRLNCLGTAEDLSRQGVVLREGMALTLYTDDLNKEGRTDELLVKGIVCFSPEEHCWVAAIDWAAIRHASEIKDSSVPSPNHASR
jgi:hypothetical protein